MSPFWNISRTVAVGFLLSLAPGFATPVTQYLNDQLTFNSLVTNKNTITFDNQVSPGTSVTDYTGAGYSISAGGGLEALTFASLPDSAYVTSIV